jgi:RHH-type rel operon transcriptional repressor/antitoxin RelB
MTKVLNVRVSEDLAKKLESLAVKTKRPKSFYIKELLEMYLDELEDAYLALERLNEKNAKYYTAEEAEKILGL